MALPAGAQLGVYEIVALVGAGGMGEVYRARDTRLDRTVAIKVLPSQFAADPQLRDRFDREARAISSLKHPHICALYDVGRHAPSPDPQPLLVTRSASWFSNISTVRLWRNVSHGAGPLVGGGGAAIAIGICDALDQRASLGHRASRSQARRTSC